MERLFEIDRQLFLFLNGLPHTTLSDAFALFLSGVGTYGFIWALLGLWIFLREEEKDHWFFLQFMFAGLASYITTEVVLKPLIGRFRPYTALVTTVVGTVSGGYSFPSGHATFAFALATVLSRKEPRAAWWFFLLAIAVSFSRIYLGQHYPLDVVAGAASGSVVGVLSLAIGQLIRSGVGKKRMGEQSS